MLWFKNAFSAVIGFLRRADAGGTQNEVSKRRIMLFWGMLFLLIAALFGRISWLMFWSAGDLVSKSNDRILRTATELQERGVIYDRNGEMLAHSVPMRAVVIHAKSFHDYHENRNLDKEATIKELCELLRADCQSLSKKLREPRNRHVTVARQVDPQLADYIKSLKIDGVYVNPELRRYYPTAERNAHIIGMTNIDGAGIEGLERQYNDYLLSSPGKVRRIKDSRGNVIENLGVVKEGKEANDLVLSIDERLQSVAYKTLKYHAEINKATSASLVLIDAWTGEILSMVNYPSYNPNSRESYAPYRARNRAVTDTYEPGSTTKPLVAVIALGKGVTTWNEVFDTLPFQVQGKQIKDSHYMASGNLFEILKYSSNVGMARIAMRMDPRDIVKGLESFGYGSRTNIEFSGENTGRLPHRKRWSNIEKATLGYGYGITVTPLQVAQAYSVLANHGIKKPLSILKVDKAPEGVRVAREKDVDLVLKSLEAVVEGGGTGTQAMITGYRVGGKTGTAKVAVAGGYGNDYVGTFAGIAPMSNPRFALVVVINEPHAGKFYGGAVAGPVFSDVMKRCLELYNIPPDDLNPDGTLKTPAQKKKDIANKKRH